MVYRIICTDIDLELVGRCVGVFDNTGIGHTFSLVPLFLAMDSGRVAGCLSAIIVDRQLSFNIAVVPEHRMKGIAYQLIEDFLSYAHRKKREGRVDSIRVYVIDDGLRKHLIRSGFGPHPESYRTFIYWLGSPARTEKNHDIAL